MNVSCESPETEQQHNVVNKENDNDDLPKTKPFYKEWWFWAIILLFLFALRMGNNNESGSSDAESSGSANSEITTQSNSVTQQEDPLATEQQKEKLRSSIDEARDIDVSKYTDATTASLAVAITKAEEVYEKSNATSKEVEKASLQLSMARETLKEKIEPVVLKGKGDDVVDIPDNLSTCLVTAEYKGRSNFVIKSLDKAGDSIDLLVNTIGAYSGTTTTGMRDTEAAFLEIKASGAWTITLRPVEEVESITSGQAMHGDNVVMAITGDATKLKIKNNGKSNFAVIGISGSSSKLLVNEIGNYSGTVVNNGYTIFVVQSDGDWTISW